VKFLGWLSDFEIKASGGYAIYIAMCTFLATLLGFIQIWKIVENIFHF
jgi:hypothetical protein